MQRMDQFKTTTAILNVIPEEKKDRPRVEQIQLLFCLEKSGRKKKEYQLFIYRHSLNALL